MIKLERKGNDNYKIQDSDYSRGWNAWGFRSVGSIFFKLNGGLMGIHFI